MGGDLRDKAGGLICVGHPHSVLDDRLRRLLDAGVCGVLLHGPAYQVPDRVAALAHEIKSYAGRPIFLSVDHEAAAEHDESCGFTRLPDALRLGQTEDVELARHLGHVLGRELRAVGIDMTLGPVLDVHSNPHNLVVRDRGLHSDPAVVARLGAALVEGQQGAGVAACVKHFPGHGDTVLDSNVALPSLPHGVARLDEVELVPFVAAIDARVAGVMVGHIAFGALDAEKPASLSRAIVYGLLRQRLQFRGFIMTDDIDMAALTKEFSRDEVARAGIASGADCFLCARRPESAFELILAIERGVDQGAVLPERMEAARRRIQSLLHRYQQDPGERPNLDVVGKQTTFEALEDAPLSLIGPRSVSEPLPKTS